MVTDRDKRVGAILRMLREQTGHTQEDVAGALDLNNRQSIGQIEAGERRVSPEELVRLGEFFRVPVSRFTDRFEPARPIAFSFRAREDDPDARGKFQARASKWLTLFTELGRGQRVHASYLQSTLGLSEGSSYEDAQAAGEEVARAFQLGDFPGTRLADRLDGAPGVLVLHVEASDAVSGAAARLDPVSAIFINRADSPGRRNFDLAHELFHLLTWDRMRPPELELVQTDGPGATDGRRSGGRDRREQLADNFAAALLMPARVVKELWLERQIKEGHPAEDVVAWMADEFRVSASAVAWRLHNLELVDRVRDLPSDAALARSSASGRREPPRPQLFNREFVQRVRVALDDGTLSFRRAAQILNLDSLELVELIRSYGMQPPYEA